MTPIHTAHPQRNRKTRRTRTPKYGGHGNQCGDPVESKRLREPFLRYLGMHGYSQATGFRIAGVPYAHGAKWLAGEGAILRAEYQPAVREMLDRAGVLVSPAG